MNLLRLDSSVLGPHSVSRQVSAAIVDRLRQATPSLDVVYRDLAENPLAHLSGSHRARAVAVRRAHIDICPIPSQRKAGIDRIAVRGKTFSYGPNGPQGLAGGKR